MIRPANEQANFPPPALGMAAVLVAALLVGLAFNSANPLGVRAGAAPAQKSPGTPAGMESPYQNETVSLGLALEDGSPAAAPALAAPAAEPVIVPLVESLTWPETKKLLDGGNILLVDAREAVYYNVEHIPGAVSLPATSNAGALLAFGNKYPKNTAIVVYCGSTQCPLSNQLVSLLKGQLGFTNVREMPGGFAEYRVATSAGNGGAK